MLVYTLSILLVVLEVHELKVQVVDSGRGSDGVEAQEDGVRAGKPREEGEHFCQEFSRFQVLRELVTHTWEVD